ncbi:hypothetical protein [uncultured Microscilla sp.]|uniref:hypothetical protein n=1 Tax=uncultured Microscilla sp. TaxID=432653 RepID=UPI002610A5BB|nr:hypothetical protein [uncultured Microscilla sp.]
MLDRIEKIIYDKWFEPNDFIYYCQSGSAKKANGLTFSAALLRFTAYYNTKTKVRRLKLPGVVTGLDLRDKLVELIQDRINQGQITIALSVGGRAITVKSLSRKAKKFQSLGFDLSFLEHQSINNQNAVKLTPTAKGIIKGLYCLPQEEKATIGKAYQKYIAIIESDMTVVNARTNEVYDRQKHGLIKISISTFQKFLWKAQGIIPIQIKHTT